MDRAKPFGGLFCERCMRRGRYCVCAEEEAGEFEHREVYPPFQFGLKINPPDGGPWAWTINQHRVLT